MITIGILLPKSVIYPSISFDIMEGLKHGLAHYGAGEVGFKTENIGSAGDEKAIYAACERLLFEGAKIIVGYLNAHAAEKLQPLMEQGDALLIVLDAGQHFPLQFDKGAKNIFNVSLQGVLCCQVAARLATERGLKKFAYTGSFYDAGYRSAMGFYDAVHAADGSFVAHQVTKLARKEFTLEPIKESLEGNPDAAVIAAFCGDMLLDFFTHASQDTFFAGRSVIGSAFVGDEHWLAQSPYPGCTVHVCVPWSTTLDNEENRKFTTAMGKRKPNYFSFLAWTASAMVAEAIKHSEISAAISVLEGMRFDSPAGVVTVNAGNHHTESDVYEAQVQRDDANGNCTLQIVRRTDITAVEREKVYATMSKFDGHASSWHNAYGCLES